MVQIVRWPAPLIRQSRANYFLRTFSRSAGTSLVGVEQIITNGAARWELELTLSPLVGPNLRKGYEARILRMEGRTNIAEFDMVDPFSFGFNVPDQNMAFSDGTFFDDAKGLTDITNPGIPNVTTTVDAVAGATRLDIDWGNQRMVGGDEFSINYFLYRVQFTGNNFVRILPRLREDVPAGTPLTTSPPRVRMRFATDEEGRRDREPAGILGPTTLRFVEAFDR